MSKDKMIITPWKWQKFTSSVPNEEPIHQYKKQNMNKEQFHIVRAEKAGVFLCKIAGVDGQTYSVTNIRRLYYWSGALDVSMIALEGVTNPSACKFSVQLGDEDLSTIHNVVESHPVSEKALAIINKIAPWKI